MPATAVALLLVLGSPVLILAACGDEDGPGDPAVELVGEGCRDGGQQSLRPYSLGAAFEGLALETVLLQCNGRPRGDTISYIYGDCEPPAGGDGGCAPPLEMQVWRACARTYRDYSAGNRPALSSARGVPVANFERQIEVYTDSTVIIFANDQGLAQRAVSALRAMPRRGDPSRVSAGPQPRGDLPQPPPGALENTLRCGP